MMTPVLACTLLMVMAGCAHDNPATTLNPTMPTGTGFQLLTSKGAAGEHKYSVFIPRDYKPTVKYPAIVFLHGIGESGGDGWGCTTVGLGPAVAQRNGNFPFIVIFPQTGMDWCSDDSEKIMLDALHDAEQRYPNIDQDRISLTGMSSGGKGTWYLGAKHPEIFAALVPMGGFASDDSIPALKQHNMPIWALHNDGDFIVSSGNTKDMISKLEAAGAHPRSTIYPQGGHDCWDTAYDEGELFQWMLAQRRGGSMPAASMQPAAAPNPYAKQMSN
jgi:predicted peptidase